MFKMAEVLQVDYTNTFDNVQTTFKNFNVLNCFVNSNLMLQMPVD